MFQFPVVYDTMSVFDNLAFPLRNQGMAEAKVHSKVQEIAEVLDLQNLLSKKRVTSLPTKNRKSPWAVAWCVTTSRRFSSTSR